MAFIPSPQLPAASRGRSNGRNIGRSNGRNICRRICAQYLSPDAINVRFDSLNKAGNFGGVFFGQYADPNNPSTSVEVVVKCPIESELGRQLYNMEKYTNMKLLEKCAERTRFPPFLGEVIVPRDSNLVPGLVRLGLVWKRVGNGDTLEDFLTATRVSQLAGLLGAIATASPLRRSFAAKVAFQLGLVLRDLQECGIVHRDVKPANLLVVPGDPDGAPLKAIDFGSSCDWGSPFKKGLGLATCDPVYTAPERRLDIFKPAYRFDVYSIGLIVLRCALPSLMDANAMQNFVNNVLAKCDFSFEKTCSAVVNGRVQASQPVKADIAALLGPNYEDMYSFFATMLNEDPGTRAGVRDILRNRFVSSAQAALIV